MTYDRLFAELEKLGWLPQQGKLMAPNGTMWLDTVSRWPPDLLELQKDMESRRARIERFLDTDPETSGPALEDVLQVIAALQGVLGDSPSGD